MRQQLQQHGPIRTTRPRSALSTKPPGSAHGSGRAANHAVQWAMLKAEAGATSGRRRCRSPTRRSPAPTGSASAPPAGCAPARAHSPARAGRSARSAASPATDPSGSQPDASAAHHRASRAAAPQHPPPPCHGNNARGHDNRRVGRHPPRLGSGCWQRRPRVLGDLTQVLVHRLATLRSVGLFHKAVAPSPPASVFPGINTRTLKKSAVADGQLSITKLLKTDSGHLLLGHAAEARRRPHEPK